MRVRSDTIATEPSQKFELVAFFLPLCHEGTSDGGRDTVRWVGKEANSSPGETIDEKDEEAEPRPTIDLTVDTRAAMMFVAISYLWGGRKLLPDEKCKSK